MAKPDSQDLYETDYYAWVNRQLELLRTGQWEAADIQNLVDEIEDMAKKIKRELESRLKVLLMHLLKWQYQPDRRGSSWEMSIKTQRHDIPELLAENPSLKSKLEESITKAYRRAAYEAHIETGYPEEDFPPNCLWTFEQFMDASFWPDRFKD
ncbi:DUF29 domain-containing protein [Endozoicomonas euniceicola]|uniref:DUF29 domain-containing protein n=1 Tax=Endozoicomonas euniceicola TaxID=1234143 RepID=A0ABY6H0D0_9GAMM|nr:DUF29 domain-containing protein [Endozoicomonas euniceicola]UYM18502.1 DUF29 domain-containing protein [Endozoicomonas euniceicola]